MKIWKCAVEVLPDFLYIAEGDYLFPRGQRTHTHTHLDKTRVRGWVHHMNLHAWFHNHAKAEFSEPYERYIANSWQEKHTKTNQKFE